MSQESCKKMNKESECQSREAPILCSNHCGFFGNPATMNMCSKCYKDHLISQSQSHASAVSAFKVDKSFAIDESVASAETLAFPSPSPLPPDSSVGSSSPAAPAAACSNSEEAPKEPNRCHSCRKRVGLTGFKCRCGDVFCSIHRYSDKHNCSFDYRTFAKRQIQKANPVIKAEKIQKI